MTRFAMLSIALLLGAPAAAQEKAQSTPDGQSATEAPSPKLESLLQNCDAHKFETTVESTVDGQPHRSKVKMCGNEGQSDAEWIKSLQDAIAKLRANQEMAADTRDQIIDAITAEVARLQSGTARSTHSSSSLPPPRAAESKPLGDDYSLLPPLPNADSVPSPHVLSPGVDADVGAGAASLNASPSEGVVPPATASLSPPAQTRAGIANPRLAFSCISPEFAGGGPCVTISRDTILSMKAPQAVTAPLSLRFVRQGDLRAELAIGTMRKGQTVSLKVPQEVCKGVVTSEVQVEVVGAGQILDRQGPYLLHC